MGYSSPPTLHNGVDPPNGTGLRGCVSQPQEPLGDQVRVGLAR